MFTLPAQVMRELEESFCDAAMRVAVSHRTGGTDASRPALHTERVTFEC